MPRNGSGSYSQPVPNFVAGTIIGEGAVNSWLGDLGREIQNSIAADGQTPPTANLPMGGFKHTGVGNATARAQYLTMAQAQDGAATWRGTAGGTADAITLTTSPLTTAYTAGEAHTFVTSGANTGAVTINVNALGAKALKTPSGAALVAGDLPAAAVVGIVYDGTDFRIAAQAGDYVTVSGDTMTGALTLPSSDPTDPNHATRKAYVDARVLKSGDTMTGNLTVPSLNSGPLAGMRNRIINGAMAVDQRNAGAAQTFTAGAALAYCVDRWYGYSTGANVTGQRVTGAVANTFRYRFTGAASVTAIGFGQRIEALNSADLAGETVTLGVDLANSLLTSVTWTAYYANTTDTFGTLASPTRTQIATGTFTVTSTVTRYNTQISVPAAATTGIEIVFTVGAQTSGTWTIGNVQLEIGSVATPFERRQYGQELALCQRYYEVFGFTIKAGTVYHVPYSYKATKRTNPTLALVAGTLSGATIDGTAYNPEQAMRQNTAATTLDADAQISASAEL